ncbi:hypothetical protein ABEW34_24965 [Paenibacillus algorifonticola]|uniref:prenyltransferase/squalene oxidase repeat-containing protein n=1 Tax=Paenibacillus algorifonticola TaxID=684063 RepID=UPI003D2D9D3F
MRIPYRKTVVVAVISVLLILVTFAILQPPPYSNDTISINKENKINDAPQEYVQREPITLTPLASKLSLMQTSDKGYGYLTEEATNLADLYSTYYALKSMELLTKKSPALPDRTGFELLKGDTDKIPLTNIYYYCSIFNDFQNNQELGNQIKTLILKMRYEDGTFAPSVADKDLLVGGQKDYLSTYMALYAIRTINPDYDMSGNRSWIEDALNSEVLSPNAGEIEKMAEIKVLIDLADIISPSIVDNYHETLLILLNEYQKYMISPADAEQPLSNLSIFLDLAERLNFSTILSEENIIHTIQQYKKADGGFSLFLSDKSNALPTYLAVKLLNDYKRLEDSEKEIEAFIERFKLFNNFYIPINYIESDIVSTYYALKIAELAGNNSVNEHIEEYLNNHEELKEHPYYWAMKVTYAQKNLTKIDKISISKLFIKAADAFTEHSGRNEAIELHTFLSIMNDLQIPIDIEVKNKVIAASEEGLETALNKANTEMATLSFLALILVELGEQELLPVKDINREFANNLKNVTNLTQDELEYLYFSLITLKQSDLNEFEDMIANASFRDSIANTLAACYIGNGLFSYSSDQGNIDLKSVFYGVWVYENIIRQTN